MAEDLCAISLDGEGQPVVHPGYRHVKLWADALDHFGDAFRGGRPVRSGLQKYSVPLGGSVGGVPFRARRVYFLSSGRGRVFLQPINGKAKLAIIRANTYRRRLGKGCADAVQYFTTANAVARSVEFVQVRRPLNLGRLGDVVRCLEADLRSDER